MDGTIGLGPIEQDIDASFSDIVSNLDVGGSVYAGLGIYDIMQYINAPVYTYCVNRFFYV